MKKAADAGHDPYLALLKFRNTPSEYTHTSPAGKMFGCRQRTHLHVMTEARNTRSMLLKAKEKQKKYCDHCSLEMLSGCAGQGRRTGHWDAVFEPQANVTTMWRWKVTRTVEIDVTYEQRQRQCRWKNESCRPLTWRIMKRQQAQRSAMDESQILGKKGHEIAKSPWLSQDNLQGQDRDQAGWRTTKRISSCLTWKYHHCFCFAFFILKQERM